jgi:dTDP-4-amino-4,6-dideoxygalactose transaminase
MIPMVDLKAQYAELREEFERGLRGVFDSCAFILGPNVQAFEKETAAYLGVRHAIGCASGTDALHLALRAAGVKAGDEVITTAFTFFATAEAIAYVGAQPVFVDIHPKTFNIDPDEIEKAITPKTTAILPVHLFGQPCAMTAIQAIADRHGLKIVEDCAQSFGASIAGRQTGGFGAASGFSFFPSKNLGGYGDGGLVTTNDDAAAEFILQLRSHGSKVRYYHDVIGYNSRLDEIQAVFLRAKLKHIDRYNHERRRVARLYSGLLADLPVETPFADGAGEHVYHQYTLLSERRDDIQKALQSADIASAIYYPVPLHRQNVFKEECAAVHLPVTEDVARRCLSLPIYPELDEDSIRRVVDVIGATLRG